MTDPDRLIAANREAFGRVFGGRPSLIAAAPGRINVIGEHTDYNGGLSMPGAIDRWTLAGLRPRSDRRVAVYSERFDASASWILGQPAPPDTGWQKRIFGLVEVFSRRRELRRGFDACLTGNLPVGAGVSSSAAVAVALLNALRAACGAALDDLSLVRSCQQVEHEFMGIGSGLLDQYASQFSRQGKLMVVDFDRLSHDYLEVEPGTWRWVLVDSLVRRELAASAYLERVAETRRGFEILAGAYPGILRCRDIAEDHLAALDDATLRRRLRHFVTENQRVKTAADLLQQGRWLEVGELLTASHESLERDYQVSCAELDALVAGALAVPGCAGARLMGGGFGGCTINLVEDGALEAFARHVEETYRRKFALRPAVTVYELGPGAKVLEP